MPCVPHVYMAIALLLPPNSRGPVGHDVSELEDSVSGEVVEEDDVDGPLARLVVDHERELDAAEVSGEHHRLK